VLPITPAVPPAAKKPKPKRRIKAGTSPPDAIGIVVRRGARRRFNALTRKTVDLPVVVSWDQRHVDRRAASRPAQVDRRRHDRRQKPPFTWEVADFVVVNRSPEKAAPAPRKARPKKAKAARTKRS